jgi:hypothetical protein
MIIMKATKAIVCAIVSLSFVAAPLVGFAAEPKKEVKPYPLQTCVVTGEKLGGMGEAHVFTYKGREIKLCCKGCVKAFEKEPDKYIKMLEAAEKKAK